jgi:hypothetical protein
MIEMTIVALIFKTVVFTGYGFSFATPNIEVYITRFITGTLLHMELIEEVKQGLNMLEYMNNNPDEFSNCFVPFLVACMQYFGGLIAEFTNMFMLASRTSVAECITFFVAFHVLTAIDNIYAEGLADFSLQEAVETPLVYTKESYKIKLYSRSISQ